MTGFRGLLPLALSALSVAGLSACRDRTTPPTEPERPEPSPTGRVTFSQADDRSPAWSPDGDSIYYVTDGERPFVRGAGFLAAISLRTNLAASLRPDIQFAGGLEIRARDPRPSPGGAEVVFVELLTLHPPDLCRLGSLIICEPDADPVSPAIARIGLRIRDRDLTPGRADVAYMELRIPGPDLEASFPRGSTAVFETRYFPFQEEFIREGGVPFGPSFAPDGRRLVVSDGLRLHVWDRDSGEVVELEGGEGGLRPRWSPTGDRIAFTREVRGDSLQVYCQHRSPIEPDFVVCHQYRWVYLSVGRHVALVPAEGGPPRILWPGRDPAWHPDGRRLVFVRDDGLWLGSIDGGDPVPVSDTEGAREPAVSPDGTRIAFARKVGASHDIWVIPFPGG